MADKRQGWLAEVPLPGPRPKLLHARLKQPVWTETKAKLIERYLFYFVLITRHGTYIDGFAGPQEVGKPEMWAANLVMNSEPKWLRHFFLFEVDPKKCRMLRELHRRAMPLAGPGEIKRNAVIRCEDFNKALRPLLNGRISRKEATFCLLDQHTFECHWSTVKALAQHKRPPATKIELFYFLGTGWLSRALTALKDDAKLRRWWGRDDWKSVRDLSADALRAEFCRRFEHELGYTYVTPWPIYKREGRRIMYYMIHATDHDLAPGLMRRAYKNALGPAETAEQVMFEWGLPKRPDVISST